MPTTDYTEIVQTPTKKAPAPWLVYLLFALGASLYLLPFMRALDVGSDEGMFLVGATRIVHGQVFARDFLEIVGPGTFYWMAAFFKLFGVTFFAARVAVFLPLLGTGLTLFYLSRQVCERYRIIPCLLLAGPYFGLSCQVESHHVDSNFFALLSVACLVLWHTKRRNSLVIAAGAFAGIATCVLQPKGVLLLGAFVVWLWLQRRRIASPLLVIGLAIGSFLGLVGLMLAYFWSQGALGSLINANFAIVAHTYPAANTVAYAQGIKEAWGFWVTKPDGVRWAAGLGAILILPLLFIAALPAVLLILAIRYKWRSVTPEVVLLLLCGWAIWLSEFHRRDIHHLAYGSPLLVVLCVHMLSQSRGKLVKFAVPVLAVCAVCLAVLDCATVAAIHRVPTRVGLVAVSGPSGVPILNFLNDHVQPGDEILSYPCAAVYYFLSATTNPAPYSGLYYNQATPAQFQEVIAILDQRQVRYVVWDTTLIPRFARDGLMPGTLPSSPDQYIMEPYLQSHYTIVKDEKGVLVMERKH